MCLCGGKRSREGGRGRLRESWEAEVSVKSERMHANRGISRESQTLSETGSQT